MIRVQKEDFDIGLELANLTKNNFKIGGLASFVGLVRDMTGTDTISSMTLAVSYTHLTLPTIYSV